MTSNGSGIAASITSPCHPWCTIPHADPVFDLDCHVSDIDWTDDDALGLGLVTSDGAPVTVEVLWDHTRESACLTPDEARQFAAALLQYADTAEKSNAKVAAR